MESKLEIYLEKWNLKNPKLLATTATSTVYEVERDELLVLKIFSTLGMKDESSSVHALMAWKGDGAVNLKGHDEGALLLERLEGPDLYKYSKEGRESEATAVFCEVIKKIHSAPLPLGVELRKLSSLFMPLKKQGGELFRKAYGISEKLLSSQHPQVLLHGDLHHENVMRRKNGEYVCLDPKAFMGDPAYEIATILVNPWMCPAISESEDVCLERARAFSNLLGLDYIRVLRFAFVHACLSAVWAIDEGKDNSHQMKIAGFLVKHV